MNVRDLLILTFPGDGNDAEVVQGGRALFAKYVQKHITPIPMEKKALDEKEKSPVVESKKGIFSGGRVWLMNVNHQSDTPTTELLLDKTDVFDPKSLLPKTGIYMVFHAQYGVPSMFGVNSMNVAQGASAELSTNGEGWAAGASGKAGRYFQEVKYTGNPEDLPGCL